jgi:septum formation protein
MSHTRRKLCESVGLEVDAVPARLDEEAIRQSLIADGASPRDISDALGEMKALKVQEKRPDAVVIGSDQILALGGEVLGKPADREGAARQLLRLQGQQHVLFSSAVVYFEGQPIWRSVGQARLRMHAMDPDEIDRYLMVAWSEVEGSVGAYHAEGYGARLFSRIEGDWFSVMGLPLLDLCSFFRLRGWLP